jgi:hypothetical protein
VEVGIGEGAGEGTKFEDELELGDTWSCNGGGGALGEAGIVVEAA